MDSFVEQLEQTHEFPGPYTLKVIGTNDPAFVARVVAIVRRSLGMQTDPVHSERLSGSGRHVSVTLELVPPSAAAVAALYGQLQSVEGLAILI